MVAKSGFPRLFFTFPVSFSTVEVVAIDSQGEPVGASSPESVTMVVTALI